MKKTLKNINVRLNDSMKTQFRFYNFCSIIEQLTYYNKII